MNSIKVCEYSRSRSFHDDLILQDQASGERSQDQWSSGYFFIHFLMKFLCANCIAPNGTLCSAASHMGLCCLPMSHKTDARLK